MIYRKQGASVRWENGTLIRVTESGVAIEDGETFRCHPEQRQGPPATDASHVMATAAAIQSMTTCERLIVTEGLADHELGDR
ncbi:MAG TPA: hypothetical protein VEU30_01165, partial [Thermoanaerobaculia bacterium]|nr:hypothetical protein [Thermoanaerobaculia bacterium]